MAMQNVSRRRPAGQGPAYGIVLLRVITIVFVAELAVMVLLSLMPERLFLSQASRSMLLPIIDSALLVALVAPAIYVWAIRPYVDGRRSMAQLLLLASHELRTPLNGIAGLIDIAADAPEDPAVRDYLLAARRKATDLSGRLDQILNYSQLENGTLTASLAAHPLAQCLALPVDACREAAREKRLGFETNLPDRAAGLIVRTDCSVLRLLVAQLLDNAVKFTSAGKVSIMVAPPCDETGHVRITITDTGDGIDPGRLRRLIADFTRGDMDYSRSSGGLGLGLAISRRLARLIGADLALGPDEEGGTRAVLTVPLSAAEQGGGQAAAPGLKP